jgi:hypothetical protein
MLGIVMACSGDSTSPAYDLNGQWLATQGGIQAALDLTQSGGMISGSAYWSLRTESYHGVIASGTYHPPNLTLIFVEGGGIRRFDGTVLDNGKAITGTLRMARFDDTLGFIKQP